MKKRQRTAKSKAGRPKKDLPSALASAIQALEDVLGTMKAEAVPFKGVQRALWIDMRHALKLEDIPARAFAVHLRDAIEHDPTAKGVVGLLHSVGVKEAATKALSNLLRRCGRPGSVSTVYRRLSAGRHTVNAIAEEGLAMLQSEIDEDIANHQVGDETILWVTPAQLGTRVLPAGVRLANEDDQRNEDERIRRRRGFLG